MNAFTDPLKPRDILLLVGTSVLAWPVLTVGLVGPLTPSHDTPTVASVIFFYLVPVATLAFAAYLSRNLAIRGMLLIQSALMLIAGGYFVYPQFL